MAFSHKAGYRFIKSTSVAVNDVFFTTKLTKDSSVAVNDVFFTTKLTKD